MRKFIFILFLSVGMTNGCWKQKSVVPTTTTTTTASSLLREVEETVQASNSHLSESARAPSTTNVDNTELRNFSEKLFALDSNSVRPQVTLNYQGKTSSRARNDAAPSPLISTSADLKGLTFTTFYALLDNYIANVNVVEDDTKQEKTEKNKFLDAISRTNVIKETHKFLKKKGYITGALKETLDLIWFTPYTRSRGKLSSSGFEHVFVGELKNGEVTGFHNWVYFLKEEKDKNLDYKGHIKYLTFGNKGEILKMRFNWHNKVKPVGSMFVGTSPELEMALYTICFFTRPNENCNLRMDNQKFKIRVYTQQKGRQTLVGSAFPEIY